jgi:small multidrug resistance family-3 protein
MKSILFFIFAAVCEIGGCFSFWAVLRQGKSFLWLIGGVISLILFAYFLTKVEAEFAGRAYAAYGGIYIAASILWLWIVERQSPDRWDWMGTLVCLIGTFIILFGKR